MVGLEPFLLLDHDLATCAFGSLALGLERESNLSAWNGGEEGATCVIYYAQLRF